MGLIEIIVPVLYGLAMLVLLVYALNLLWLSARSVGEERLAGGPVPEPDGAIRSRLRWPRVTVQLPVYNEAAVVERLIDACAGLDYPRESLEIQVLDDSTDVTSALVESRVERWRSSGLDIVHVKRPGRQGFKAGALANGLRFASGDFIAVLDADFVPDADFLRRTIPEFDSPDVGLVQARWAHLNERESLLTRVQAFGLDTHFALEQRARDAANCFINFNGTAGVWRRSCIESSGGWSADTLTEDLDLSYRAQLAGWRLKYVNDVEVAAELPAETSAFRSQQFRWAKGSVQTAIRLLPAVWRSGFSPRVKLEGTLHLTAHVVFPFVLLAAVLHAPLVTMKAAGRGPGEAYFALLAIGLLGLAGFLLAQLYAQRNLYPDWAVRLRLFPWFMAGTMGLSINNAHAVWQAVRGHPSPFVRTPKAGSLHAEGVSRRSPYSEKRLPAVVWAEVTALIYCLIGTAAIVGVGQWAAVPFQLLFTWGFGIVVWFSLRDRFRRPRAAASFDGIDRTGYLPSIVSSGD